MLQFILKLKLKDINFLQAIPIEIYCLLIKALGKFYYYTTEQYLIN